MARKILAAADRRRIGCYMRQRRRYLGLSQKAIGGQIGTPGQLVGEWERGEVEPTLDSFVKWCRALDIRLFDFLEPVSERA